MPESPSLVPLVLIASQEEWSGRSLESVLESNGYSVLRVDSGRRALEMARRTRPDALLLDDALPDISGVDVCRALRDDPLFDHATPIFMTAAAQQASRVRAAAFAAGAWDYSTFPVSSEILLAKLGTFIRARREVIARQAETLIDQLTGLYTLRALQQWMEQLGARAVRKSEAIACAVVEPYGAGSNAGALTEDQSRDALTEIAEICRAQSRRSDVLAYLGESQVAIVAPDTNVAGVERLIERLRDGFSKSPTRARTRQGAPSAILNVGYYAVSDFAAAKISGNEILLRAQAALRNASGRSDPSSPHFGETLPS